jgi:hypothetical protein
MMKTVILTFVLIVVSSLYGKDCASHSQHHHEHHDEDRHESARETAPNEYRIHLSQKDALNAGIRTAPAQRRSLEGGTSFYGRFELTPNSSLIVPTIVEGKLELNVSSLQNVKKGDVLFTVFSPAVLSKRREIEILSKRIEVYKKINTPNAELENLLKVKESELESILCGFSEEGGIIKVLSPADGMVEELFKSDGSWLSIGDSVVKITDMHHLRFKALLPADEAVKLHDCTEAEVEGNRGVVKLSPGNGTGLVPVYVLFENKIRAIAGQRSTMQILSHDHDHEHGEQKMIVVPHKAIVEINLKKYIFVKDKNDSDVFVAHPVRVLKTSGKFVAIDKMPYEGCQIVVEGAYELKIASSTKKNAAGHFHADGTFHDGEHH